MQWKCAAAVTVVLVATACSGGNVESARDTRTQPGSSVATTATPSSTAATHPTSLGSAIESFSIEGRTLPLIVAGMDGVFEVQVLGGTRLLIKAAVEFAIDDGQGGLLYQIHRGRPGPDGDVEHDSTIWWLPAGETSPQMLLVSTVEAGNELSLHDAYISDGLHVIYTRHERSAPSADGAVQVINRLRSFEVASGQSSDLVTEQLSDVVLDDVSCDKGVIAYSRHGAAATECRFIDFSGNDVTIPAAPRYSCRGPCHRVCMLGWDGSLLMLLQDRHEPTAPEADHAERLDFVDTATATVMDSLDLPSAAEPVAALDLRGPWLVVSSGLDERALVFDLRMLWAGPFELPVPGLSHFARAPVEIGSPIDL